MYCSVAEPVVPHGLHVSSSTRKKTRLFGTESDHNKCFLLLPSSTNGTRAGGDKPNQTRKDFIGIT